MAEKFFPFDSVKTAGVGDRVYYSQDLASVLAKITTNGYFKGFGSSYSVTAHATNLAVIVATGASVISGRFHENDSNATFALTTAHTTLSRIDTLVVRYDLPSRKTFLAVKAGTPATTPTVPSLTRNTNTWELGIANILVPAGATQVQQGNITTTIDDAARCGVASSPLDIVTSSNAQTPPITRGDGAPSIIVTSPTANVLDEIRLKGRGMNTVICETGVGGTIPSNKAWRGYSIFDDPRFGVVMAIDRDGALFVNNLNNVSGVWAGWKEYVQPSQVQMSKVTNDSGSAILRVDNPATNPLTTIKNAGAGFRVTWVTSGAVGSPSGSSWYGISHLQTADYGFVQAVDNAGRVFTNTLNNGIWLGWKESATVDAVQISKITTDAGGATVNATTSAHDFLALVLAKGVGFNTVYGQLPSTNLPSSASFRGISHFMSANYGYVYGIDATGVAYSNYCSNGTWGGWKQLPDVSRVQMKKVTQDNGNAIINASAGQSILTQLISAGAGFYTVSAVAGIDGFPTSNTWRGTAFLNSASSGFLIADDVSDGIYTNTLTGGAWQGWKLVPQSSQVQMKKITQDDGSTLITATTTAHDPLAMVLAGGRGMSTIYASANALSPLPTGREWRGIGIMNLANYGSVLAVDSLGYTYTNTCNGGVWVGWRRSNTATKEPLTLQNGWLNYGSVYENAQVFRDAEGAVAVTGMLKSGTTTGGTILTTLPAQYRPSATVPLNAHAVNASGVVTPVMLLVHANGNITLESTAVNNRLNINATWLVAGA